jgi:hypothetical protein
MTSWLNLRTILSASGSPRAELAGRPDDAAGIVGRTIIDNDAFRLDPNRQL